jgi:hypothetical protein
MGASIVRVDTPRCPPNAVMQNEHAYTVSPNAASVSWKCWMTDTLSRRVPALSRVGVPDTYNIVRFEQCTSTQSCVSSILRTGAIAGLCRAVMYA